MKKILITGKNSYIGNALRDYLKNTSDSYLMHSLDLRNQDWSAIDFSKYDSIVYVAGIAHLKETKKNQSLYDYVNTELPFLVAKKAKDEGVKQFVFLSSMSIYGIEKGTIKSSTIPKPNTMYGLSKFSGEQKIITLNRSDFNICIIRPPMVYGKNCPGNYTTLSKVALVVPFFPSINNKRSMIYIDNLTEFIKQAIDRNYYGVFHPENLEPTNVSNMVFRIAEINKKTIIRTNIFNPIIKMIPVKVFSKIFGDLILEDIISCKIGKVSLEDSIILTEKSDKNPKPFVK